jgi:outer membrane protein TolC
MLPAKAWHSARRAVTRTCVALLSLVPVARASAQALSLDDCQTLARNNYPLVRQYELIEKSREFTLSNASKAYFPQLSVTGIGAYVFGDLPSFSPPGSETEKTGPFHFIGLAQLNQVIWDGGATKAQKKIISASSNADKAALDVAMYELRSRVNQLYFGILLVDEQLAQLVAQDAILSNNVSRIQQLSDNGLAFTTDLDELKVEQLKREQQRVELRYVRQGYVRMLSLLIGRELGEDAKLTKPAVDNQKSELTISRPELTLYTHQRKLVDAQLSLQETELMPKIGILGVAALIEPGIGLGSQTISFLGVVGLTVSWSTAGLYRRGNNMDLAQVSLRRIGLQEETFRFNTKIALTQTSANIEKLRAILAGDEAIVQLRQGIRESYQVKYNAGSSPLLDLLNATEQESGARSQHALHEMQLLVAIFEQQTLTGH